MESLCKRREKVNLNFAKKCLKIKNMKALFSLNSKDHGMKTRRIMKYNKAKNKGNHEV